MLVKDTSPHPSPWQYRHKQGESEEGHQPSGLADAQSSPSIHTECSTCGRLE